MPITTNQGPYDLADGRRVFVAMEIEGDTIVAARYYVDGVLVEDRDEIAALTKQARRDGATPA
jgi:hypothetical protein